MLATPVAGPRLELAPGAMNSEAVALAPTAAAAALALSAAATLAIAASTSAAETSASATETSTSAATRALGCFIDANRPTVELHAVKLGDGVGRCLLIRHGDEREAARASRFAVEGKRDFAYLSDGCEGGLDARLGRAERKIAYEKTISHVRLSVLRARRPGPNDETDCRHSGEHSMCDSSTYSRSALEQN